MILWYSITRKREKHKKKEREDKTMKLFNKKEEKKVAKRFFVTEPWSFGETFGFETYEEACKMCDECGIEKEYIQEL